MCGIAGFIDYSNHLKKQDLIAMTDVLSHRGPDDAGYKVWQTENAAIGFGHRRLSILDLSKSGKQPMSKHGLHITYNGEVYNHKEIKKELENLGYSFFSNSDTEVILSAFDAWGTDSVHKFIGMFAFAIYREKDKKVFFFRDRAGVKPLYYYWKNGIFLFSSELKAFHQISSFYKSLNMKSIGLFFQYGYISTPNCIFENCYKLEQGHYLIFDLAQVIIEKNQYWDVFDYAKARKDILSEEECLKETEKILSSACNYRMVSDVPVGIFLSGGYDSSLVTTLIQKETSKKVKTYTIAFEDDRYNEAKHAKMVANHLGTDHQEMMCTMEEAKSILPIIPDISDEPFGDSSIIPTYLVSKMARQQVKVALSSDAGDEQFIGYNRYPKAIKLASVINKFPDFINKSIAILGSSTLNKSRINKKIWQSFNQSIISAIPDIQTQNFFTQEINQLINIKGFEGRIHNLSNSRDVNSIFAAEYQNYLQDDILVKVDRAAMALSLEGREPLLDHRIAEWALGLPINLKYKNKTLKYLLKEITHKYIPKVIMDRPKQGFGIPVISWLRGDLKHLLDIYSEKSRIQKQGLFNYPFIESHLIRFEKKQPESELFIWYMLIFQMWYSKWMS